MSEKRKKNVSILSFFKKKNKPNDLAVPDKDEDVNPNDPQLIPLVKQESVSIKQLIIINYKCISIKLVNLYIHSLQYTLQFVQ